MKLLEKIKGLFKKEYDASGTQPKVEKNMRIVNVFDPGLVDNFMSTSEGSRAFLSFISKNKDQIIKALR